MVGRLEDEEEEEDEEDEVVRLRDENERLRAELDRLRQQNDDMCATERYALDWLGSQGYESGNLRSEICIRKVSFCQGDIVKHVRRRPMARACELGDLRVCKWLHKYGAEKDVFLCSSGYDDRTPMQLACEHGHLEVCVWLGGECGVEADVYSVGLACERGHFLVCQWLLKEHTATRKLHIHRTCLYDQTLMHYACDVESGNLDICKLLYDKVLKAQGIDAARAFVRETDYEGATPMYYACKYGRLEVCTWLYDAGAAEDIDEYSEEIRTPIEIAGQNGHVSVCQWLVDVGATVPDYQWRSLVKCSLLSEDLPMCKWLVEVGQTVPDDLFQSTAADMVKVMGDLSMCQWLVGAGVKVPEGVLKLKMERATVGGDLPMCQWLFEDMKVAAGWFPGARLPVCKWLVEDAGLDITGATDRSGSDIDTTVMHAAFRRGDLELCKWLVLHGAFNREDHNNGHVDPDIVRSVTYTHRVNRYTLLHWSNRVVRFQETFMLVFLRGASIVVPEPTRHNPATKRCYLPRLPRIILEKIADALGVERGRRLRNAREFLISCM